MKSQRGPLPDRFTPAFAVSTGGELCRAMIWILAGRAQPGRSYCRCLPGYIRAARRCRVVVTQYRAAVGADRGGSSLPSPASRTGAWGCAVRSCGPGAAGRSERCCGKLQAAILVLLFAECFQTALAYRTQLFYAKQLLHCCSRLSYHKMLALQQGCAAAQQRAALLTTGGSSAHKEILVGGVAGAARDPGVLLAAREEGCEMTANAGGKAVQEGVVRALPAERVTVALIPQAGEDLQRLQDRTGLSKTDIVNRAITLYEFFDAQLKAGRDLIIRDPKTGETQLVRFL